MKLRERKPASPPVKAALTVTKPRTKATAMSTRKNQKKKKPIDTPPPHPDSLATTTTTTRTVGEFIAAIEKETMRRDVQELHDLVTRLAPDLAVTLDFKNILAYGKYHYRYKSGREGDWYRIGISVGKTLSLHCGVMSMSSSSKPKYVVEEYASRIGKAKCGKSCVRFQRLADLNLNVVEELIQAAMVGNTF